MSEMTAYAHLALSLGLLFIVYRYLWKPQRVSILRDDLFALRQELFDLARSEQIAFTHPAYIRLRGLLNANIRYAHKATGALVLVMTIVAPTKPGKGNLHCQLCSALDDKLLPKEVRAKLVSIHSRMGRRIAQHLIFGSPIFTVLAALYGSRQLSKEIEAKQLCPSDRIVRIAQVSLVEREAIEDAAVQDAIAAMV